MNTLSLEDPKKDWCKDSTPLIMEVEQAKDPNVDKIKECLLRNLELNQEHLTTRMRKLLKQLPRLTVQNNVLNRKFLEHNGDYYLQTVIPEHFEQELLCRLHDQMQHAGIQKCVTEFSIPQKSTKAEEGSVKREYNVKQRGDKST